VGGELAVASKIKGIVVEIGGDTSGLTKALSDVDGSLKSTQTQLNKVEKALKLDPTNVALAAEKQKLLQEQVYLTSDKLKMLEENQAKVNKAFAANESWEKQYAPIKQAIDETREKLKKLQSQEEEYKEKLASGKISTEEYENYQKSVEETRSKLKDLQSQKKELDDSFEDGHINADQYLEYTIELETTRAKLKTLGDKLEDTSESIDDVGDESKETSEQIKDMGDQSLKAGDIMKESIAAEAIISGVKQIAEAIEEVSTAAIEVGSEFEASMSQVGATMGLTADEIKNGSDAYEMLEDAAKDAGSSTKYTASESAEALNYLALAGYDAEKSVTALPSVLRLAQSGGMDLATASDMVTDSMSALGLETDSLDNYIDQMARTSQKSNTSVSQLGNAVLECAGTVKSTGQSVTTMNAELGVLANNGIKGAEGGTHLRNVLLSLTAPTDTAKAAMDDLGLSVSNSDGSIRDINDIMSDLNGTLKSMSDSEKTNVLNEIFNKTDLNSVNALLDGTNGSFSTLKTQLEQCDGAASDMADTMNDNFKGKITEAKSALESVGISIYGKFEQPLTSSVEKVTDRISDFRDSIEDGELSDDFDNLADGVDNLTDSALDMAEDVLPKVINLLGWIIDNYKPISYGLTAIGGAMVINKGIKSIEAGITAMKNLKTALTAAKTASDAANKSMESNPYLLIAEAAITAGVVIKGFIDKHTDAIDETLSEYDTLTEKQRDFVDSCEEFNQSIADSRTERQKSASDLDDEIGTYKSLTDKLYELDDAEQLSASDKAEMAAIVEQLNEAIPDLNLALDEETGHLINQRDEIDSLIESYEKQAKAQAAQENLVELYKEQFTAEKNLKQAELEKQGAINKRSELQLKLNSLQNEYNKLYNDTSSSLSSSEREKRLNELQNQIKQTTSDINDQKNTVGELSGAYDTAVSAMDGVNSEVDEMTKIIAENTDGVSDNTKALDDQGNKLNDLSGVASDVVSDVSSSIAEISDETKSSIEDMISSYRDAVDSRYDTITGSFNFFSGMSDDVGKSKDVLISNMNDAQGDMTDWANGIEYLSGRVSDTLVQDLEDAGPSSVQAVRALCSMTDSELETYSKNYDDAFSQARTYAETQMDKLRTETASQLQGLIDDATGFKIPLSVAFEALGEDAGDGYIEGWMSKISAIQTVANSAVNAALTAVQLAQDSHSPSKKFRKLGVDAGAGYAGGIDDEAKEVYKSVSSMVNNALKATSGADRFSLISNSGLSEDLGYINANMSRIIPQSSAELEDTTVNKRNSSTSSKKSGLPETAKFSINIDGKTFATAVAPFLDIINGQNINLASRGVTI
jgi:TP901 family phage tail tape measure protein